MIKSTKQSRSGHNSGSAAAAQVSSRRAVTCTTTRYELFERIGGGTMATVHRAIEHGDDGSQRSVALKRLLPHLGEDQDFVRSFIREVQLAARLDHPNIVRIFKLGRGATGYFISMELIDGHDLASVLELANRVAGPPPVGVVTSLLTELCAALEYAHGRTDRAGNPLELVHRDVSPANLIIERSGHLKIVDFGFSRASSPTESTRAGLRTGKFAYMAPEVIDGSACDARADVFSVGVVAHELLTARGLFAGDNDFQTVKSVLHGQVSVPSAHNSCCPPELDAIVLKALARDPDERWQSMAELGAALAAFAAALAPRNSAQDVAEWLSLARSIEPSSAEIAIGNDDPSTDDNDHDDDDESTGVFERRAVTAPAGAADDEAEAGREADSRASRPGTGRRRKLLLAAAVVIIVLVAAFLGPHLAFAPATASGAGNLAPVAGEVISSADVEVADRPGSDHHEADSYHPEGSAR